MRKYCISLKLYGSSGKWIRVGGSLCPGGPLYPTFPYDNKHLEKLQICDCVCQKSLIPIPYKVIIPLAPSPGRNPASAPAFLLFQTTFDLDVVDTITVSMAVKSCQIIHAYEGK